MCNINYLILIIELAIALFSSLVHSNNIQYIDNDNFQLGIFDLDIQRFPRYNNYPLVGKPKIVKAGSNSKKCLYLPPVIKGGYRLIFKPVDLISKKKYKFNIRLNATGKTFITVEVRSGRKKVRVKNWHLSKGISNLEFNFFAENNGRYTNVHTLKIWVVPKKYVCIGTVGLVGPSDHKHIKEVANLVPNIALGVYGINQTGSMTVLTTTKETTIYHIINPISGRLIRQGLLNFPYINGEKINLATKKRGYYRVDLINKRAGNVIAQQAYVVINKEHKSPVKDRRYGMAMEEGPARRTVINALIKPEKLYELISEMGVGSIRIFSLASPRSLSKNGVEYDFFQLDSALNLAKKYNLDVLLELGSNDIHQIPKWLRSSVDGSNMIDLTKGRHFKHEKNSFIKIIEDGRYLSLKKYHVYLQHVIDNVKDKVNFYEVWNEPGHKFLPKDYLKIVKITSEIKNKLDPKAKLLGPTSTSVAEPGKGENIDYLPNFANDTYKIGLGNYIDYLSYHSRHAFAFMGPKFDRRNQETDFVRRLELIEKNNGVKKSIIWDTERGVPWKSYHSNRLDAWDGKQSPYSWITAYNYLEPARRLPMIFFASMHQGVKRLFWFYVDSGVNTITHSKVRWSIFDANLEPMPVIPVYNAMTEIIGNAKLQKLVETEFGVRAYLFKKGSKTIIAIFNWKQRDSVVKLKTNRRKYKQLDIMGNIISESSVSKEYQTIMVNGWTQYIIISDISPNEISIL